MMLRHKNKKGFTIIELMLAMAFLGVMLVCIAVLVVHITNIYQKGLSIRAVNSVGRGLIDEFSRAVSASPIDKNIDAAEDGSGNISLDAVELARSDYFVSVPAQNQSQDGSGGNRVQGNGIFCTGMYTYIWNAAPVFNEDGNGDLAAPFVLRFSDGEVFGDGISSPKFKIVRVDDKDRSICAAYNHPTTGGSKTITLQPGTRQPIELISSDNVAGETQLVLYDLTIFPATQNAITGQIFYSATFILATLRGGIDITAQGDYCRPPQDMVTIGANDFDYCAINKFNFAMRATGHTKSEDEYGSTGAKRP